MSCNPSISQTILPTTMYVFSWVNTGIIHPCDTWRIFVRWGYSLWYSPSIEECLIGHNSITSCSIIPGCAIVARSFVCFIVEDTKWMHTVIATPLLKRGRERRRERGGGGGGEKEREGRREQWPYKMIELILSMLRHHPEPNLHNKIYLNSIKLGNNIKRNVVKLLFTLSSDFLRHVDICNSFLTWKAKMGRRDDI